MFFFHLLLRLFSHLFTSSVFRGAIGSIWAIVAWWAAVFYFLETIKLVRSTRESTNLYRKQLDLYTEQLELQKAQIKLQKDLSDREWLERKKDKWYDEDILSSRLGFTHKNNEQTGIIKLRKISNRRYWNVIYMDPDMAGLPSIDQNWFSEWYDHKADAMDDIDIIYKDLTVRWPMN